MWKRRACQLYHRDQPSDLDCSYERSNDRPITGAGDRVADDDDDDDDESCGVRFPDRGHR